MAKIYCDESGNSGERLIDNDQPFFVLASNDYSSAEARELLHHVQSQQAAEPKFKTLRKSPDGVRRLTNFLADPRLNEFRVVVDAYHKRFMVVTKIVDLVAETLAHDMGFDLYQRGANLAMANMLHCCMPAFCGEDRTNAFLQSFVDLIRHRTEAHAQAYFEAGRAMVESSSNEAFKADLFPFTEPRLFRAWFDAIGEMALEPAIPALFQHINEWGKRKGTRFEVIHDNSKPVLASREMFESMMAMTGEQSQLVGYDRRKFHFPLRATSLSQGDSSLLPQIQVADLCAGALNHLLKCQTAGQLDDLAIAIRDLGCIEWVINGVAPSTDVTPRDLGTDSEDGTNPLDAIASYFLRGQQ
jgi:hypothetical protein